MYRIFNHILDFLFPPSEIEIRLRGFSPNRLLEQSAKAGAVEFPFIQAIFSYKDPIIREMIWQIKYKKNKHAIECAGYALYSELIKKDDRSILIPIPISNKRRAERGFNQCELLINEIIKLDNDKQFSKDFKTLVRSKHIEKQTLKNRKDRIKNTQNIFEVDGNLSIDQRIIIIDDVTTTGSTLKEARNTLLQAGFTDVKALTVAH